MEKVITIIRIQILYAKIKCCDLICQACEKIERFLYKFTTHKFYVLAHNYESGLNGKGRTLFCRESPATSGIRCQRGSSYSLGWGTLSYFGSSVVNAIYEYLTATYPSSFTSTVKKWIATTKYKAYSATRYDSSPSPYIFVYNHQR